ncbi:MAG TPA: LamG-like jellyroll fold domain-containing protein [Armatimonadota bacterium]|nr:LamG-like jellyroll fold domain-containing protein [Armatimonadota bacterium]
MKSARIWPAAFAVMCGACLGADEPFSDNFDGQATWQAQAGVWRQADGSLSQTAEQEGVLTFDTGAVDGVAIIVRIRFPNRSAERYAGVTFGLDENGSGLCVYLANHPEAQHDNLVKLRTTERGRVTEQSFQEARHPIETDTWHELRVDAAGARVRVTVDGELLFSQTVPRDTAGHVGLWTSRAAADFDDLRIQPTRLARRTEGRRKHFARVKPVFPSEARERVELDGTWQFRMDPQGVGDWENWSSGSTPFSDTIRVPGSWEAQGFGDPADRPGYGGTPVSMQTAYTGAAWYRRSVTVPTAWKAKRIWLKLGGVSPNADVWCNGAYLGAHARYFEPFKFDVTDLVQPGAPSTVIVRIDNRQRSLPGCFTEIWSWGGIHRSVVLEATAPTSVRRAVVLPDLDRSRVDLEVELEEGTPLPQGLRLEAEVRFLGEDTADPPARHAMPVASGTFSLGIDVPDVRPWSAESPQLYRLDLRLMQDDRLLDVWSERFGFCKREIRGNDVFINNQQVFIRAYGDDCVYPLDIAPPASKEDYLWRFKQAKDCGFTYVRHHTWIPLPEYFQAADEVGMMLQPELPYGGPIERLDSVIRNYRNHPSLTTYSMTNEAYGGSDALSALYHHAKERDSARFAVDSDGSSGPVRETSDLWITFPISEAEGPCSAVKPVLHHEFLNLPTIPDPQSLPKFTQGIRPVATQKLAAWAKENDFEEETQAAVEASRRLQKLLQKEGIELARRQPELDGYCYWTIADFWEFGQGLFDMMWQPKGWTGAEFSRFNGANALLTELPTRTVWQGDRVEAKWLVSSYGGEDIRSARLEWRLTAGNEEVAQGTLTDLSAPPAGVTGLGAAMITVPELGRHAKLTLHGVLSWPGGSVENDWEMWSFSKQTLAKSFPCRIRFRGGAAPLAELYPSAASDTDYDLLVADTVETEDTDFLQNGGRMLLTSTDVFTSRRAVLHPGWWAPSPGHQVGLAMAEHPSLASFPHEGAAGLQVRSLLRSVAAVDSLPFPVTPVVFGVSHPLHEVCELRSCLFEFTLASGAVLVSGLDISAPSPESRALLDSVLRYATDPSFGAGNRRGAATADMFTPSIDKLSISQSVGAAAVGPGDPVPIEIRVANRSFLPCDVQVSYSLPPGLETLDSLRQALTLRGREERTISYMVRPVRPGEYALGPATLTLADASTRGEPGTLLCEAGASLGQLTSIPAVDPSTLVASWSLDEAEGQSALAASGAHEMTLQDVMWSYGVTGAALRFDGRTSQAFVPDSDSLDLPGPLTMMLWVWPAETGSGDRCLIDKGGSGRRNYAMYLNGNDLLAIFYARGAEFLFRASGLELTPRQWHHIACSYDGEFVRVFLNGQLKGEYEAALGDLEPTDTPLFLGCRGSHDDLRFNGLIDDVKILSSATWPAPSRAQSE